MKLFSQNCGGLVGFLGYAPDFKGYFESYSDCDVILIQELRVDRDDAKRLHPVLEVFEELGYPYHATLWAKKGNGGCITFSKTRLTVMEEPPGILVTHTKVDGIHYVIVNCYVPNYGYGDGETKLEFIENSTELFKKILDKGGVTIFAGDFNAVLSTSHCKRKGLPGSFPEEIKWINEIAKTNRLSCGEVTAEVTGPKGEFYTYYSFRGRKPGVEPGALLGSIRIDHVFVSANAVVETVVHNTVTLRDHFPLVSIILPKK